MSRIDRVFDRLMQVRVLVLVVVYLLICLFVRSFALCFCFITFSFGCLQSFVCMLVRLFVWLGD